MMTDRDRSLALAITELGRIQGKGFEEALTEYAGWVNLYGADGALEKAEQMKREYYLSQHHNSIYYSKADGRWRTYVHAFDGKRKPMTAKTKERLEEKLVEWYSGEAGNGTASMANLMDAFISYKGKETSLSNAQKLLWAYDTYYRGRPIASRPLGEITVPELKEFFLDMTAEHSLTARKYREAKSLMNMVYDYAVECGYVTRNVSRDIRSISCRKFTPAPRKQAPEQVYTGTEEARLQELALMRYGKTGNPACIAIAMNFALGLRAGELTALKWEDFEGSFLHVCREETQVYTKGKDGRPHKSGFTVSPYTKTPAGDRRIPVTSTVWPLLGLLRERKERLGLPGEYLFERDDGTRMNALSLSRCLRKLNAQLGTSQKGNHSIRKTCISNMYASGELTDEEIRAFAGHEDIATTRNCYVFAVEEISERQDAYERAITPKASPALRAETGQKSRVSSGCPEKEGHEKTREAALRAVPGHI